MFWVDDDFLVAQTDFNNGVTRGNQGEIYGGGAVLIHCWQFVKIGNQKESENGLNGCSGHRHSA